jgi:hypothetical protein
MQTFVSGLPASPAWSSNSVAERPVDVSPIIPKPPQGRRKRLLPLSARLMTENARESWPRTCRCEFASHPQQRLELGTHLVDYLTQHGCDSLAPPFLANRYS